MEAANNTFIFDANLAGFENDVILKSKEVPVLVDFWAPWCGPCKTLGPILEKLAEEFNGGFLLAKVDVDQEQQLAGYFQIKSIPTVMLLKDGQIVDGFPGALPEGQLREFLKKHEVNAVAPEIINGAAGPAELVDKKPAEVDYEAEVIRLRKAVEEKPDQDDLKLDYALALAHVGNDKDALQLLDNLPANLATDDRAIAAHARLGFSVLVKNAPPIDVLKKSLEQDETDLRARHLLGAQLIVQGQHEQGLEQFLAMLKQDRKYQDELPKKALIDAFRIIGDPDLVEGESGS